MKKRYIAVIVIIPVALLAMFVWPWQVRFGGESVPVSTEPMISMTTLVGSSINAAPVSHESKVDAMELFRLTGRSAVAAQQIDLMVRTPQQVTAVSEEASKNWARLKKDTEAGLAEAYDYIEQVNRDHTALTGDNKLAIDRLQKDLTEVRKVVDAHSSNTMVDPQPKPARVAFSNLPRLGFGTTPADVEMARQLQTAVGLLADIHEQNEAEDARFDELLCEIEALKAERENGEGSTD